MTINPFARKVLRWYDKHGRKTLPWQRRPTPYRVWVSEIMLQQTQVQTVIPYFQHFMQTFPNLKQLALAPIDAVLACWSGLGYYARARNLHKTAQVIYHDYRGRFPTERRVLETFPGIGRSTAAAICALSDDQAEAILDGNVKRILARQHCLPVPIESPVGLKTLWGIAESNMPSERCAAYTQAMMDLGALLCTRTQPDCLRCPVQASCQAFQSDRVADYPVLKKKVTIPTRHTAMIVLLREEAILQQPQSLLLLKRPSAGIWGGLWCLPMCDPTESAVAAYLKTWKINLRKHTARTLPTFRHTFSHYHLMITPHVVLIDAEQASRLEKLEQPVDQMNSLDRMEQTAFVWHLLGSSLPGGIPKPVSRLLQQVALDFQLAEVS